VRLDRTWFVLVQAEVDRPRNGDHIAFSVSKSTLLETAERLKSMNAEFFLARSDTALYFFGRQSHLRAGYDGPGPLSWPDDGAASPGLPLPDAKNCRVDPARARSSYNWKPLEQP